VENTLEHLYSLLKGSDAAVYQSVRALGFEPVLYLYYDYEQLDDDDVEAVLTEMVPDPRNDEGVEDTVGMLRDYGGICISREEVKWVTPLTAINCQKCTYPAYDGQVSVAMACGDVCLLVRIGEAGERLAYPTAVEVRRESAKADDDFD
jgi:hypothetical protein